MSPHRKLVRAAVIATFAVVGMLVTVAVPTQTARAASMDTCVHAPTIASLHDCVVVMTAQGVITNQGIANSMLAQVDAAQAALNRGQSGVAVNILQAFTREVSAQAGISILQPHADDLISHAELVIQSLEVSGTA
jgi:FIMAH domain-containing protein